MGAFRSGIRSKWPQIGNDIGNSRLYAMESVTIRWPGSITTQVRRRVEAERKYEAREDREGLELLDALSFGHRGFSP